MVSYLGSLVQFSPAAGRPGLQADVAVCGELSPCSGLTGFARSGLSVLSRLHCSGSRLLSMERALR